MYTFGFWNVRRYRAEKIIDSDPPILKTSNTYDMATACTVARYMYTYM